MGTPRHGYSYHPLYRVWHSMKQRCLNPNNPYYDKYGGGGVTIFEEWVDNPAAFIEWGLANGWEEGLQLDKDELCEKLNIVPARYGPDTCQFITKTKNISLSSTRNTKATNKRIKMDWDDIAAAKQMRKDGLKLQEIADIFGVSIGLISVNVRKEFI